MDYRTVVTCGFGLESILTFELKKLGMREIAAEDGRIYFTADARDLAQANVWLRTAERVLIVLATYPAPDFDALFDGASDIPWGEIVGKSEAFPVKGYTLNSALTSVPACQSVLKKAIVERLKRDHGADILPEDGVTKRIQFSIIKDQCTIMLDTTGDGLHKRGYRPLRNEAPIKETLAAGIADLARVFPDSLVADPFCGSGTLLIESAMRARNIAPGLKRKFAGEAYDFLGAALFREIKDEAAAAVKRDTGFSGQGSDIDAQAVALAKENAKRAGVGGDIVFSVGDATQFTPRAGDIVLANPPYGERLMEEDAVERLYSAFGKRVLSQPNKGLYIITNHPEFEKLIGKKATRRRKLYNGMIPCQLFMYF